MILFQIDCKTNRIFFLDWAVKGKVCCKCENGEQNWRETREISRLGKTDFELKRNYFAVTAPSSSFPGPPSLVGRLEFAEPLWHAINTVDYVIFFKQNLSSFLFLFLLCFKQTFDYFFFEKRGKISPIFPRSNTTKLTQTRPRVFRAAVQFSCHVLCRYIGAILPRDIANIFSICSTLAGGFEPQSETEKYFV